MIRILTVLLVATAGVACSSGGGGGADPAAAVTAVADDFLADMKAGAWHAAFSRLHPDLQASCGSADRLRKIVETAGERPDSWTLREPSVRNRSGLIGGSVQKTDGTPGIAEFTMERTDDGWRIWAWSASNRELCLEQGDEM